MKTEEESPKIEEEISTEKVIDTHEEEDSFEGTDKKLSDLMKRGWIMLSESCPLESCRCPLMKSPDGQKYCVQCEMWIFDHKPVKKKKFGELVPFKKPRENHTEISKKYTFPKDTRFNHPILQTLTLKLNYLNEKLLNETDVHMIEIIAKDINLILDAIKKCENI